MEDITGKIFNNLIAIRPLYQYRREWVWLCKCSCGKETKVRISKLKNNTTKSCGCIKLKNVLGREGTKHPQWGGYKDISLSFFNRIRDSAKKRGIYFDISIEYLWELFQNQKGKCIYTGKNLILPIHIRTMRGENNEFVASLDRIDNEKGYIKNNVQWVCKRINYMKSTMTEEYFLELVKDIYDYKISSKKE